MDLLIISIVIAVPVILVLGGINAIFGLDSPIRIRGIRVGSLGTDFWLVFRLTLALIGFGAILATVRYAGTLWDWLKPRPWAKWGLAALTILLVTIWLVLFFQKTPAEQLAVAIGEANLDQVHRVLIANEFESDYLDLQLGRSIEEGKFEIAAVLIAEGADVNRAQNFGGYPLLISTVMFGEADAILFLLEQGANPNQVDEFGNTSLSVLIDFRLPQENMQRGEGVVIAKALLAAGADPSLTDTIGKTAKDYAAERGYQTLLALFP